MVRYPEYGFLISVRGVVSELSFDCDPIRYSIWEMVHFSRFGCTYNAQMGFQIQLLIDLAGFYMFIR